jgi:hypothetical protein
MATMKFAHAVPPLAGARRTLLLGRARRTLLLERCSSLMATMKFAHAVPLGLCPGQAFLLVSLCRCRHSSPCGGYNNVVVYSMGFIVDFVIRRVILELDKNMRKVRAAIARSSTGYPN